jgi:hypothetical protein
MVLPDWIGRVVEPAMGVLKGLFGWLRRHRSHVIIQQDTASVLAQNFYHEVPGGLLSCVGLFLVSNYSGREIVPARIECPGVRANLVHLRWMNPDAGQAKYDALPPDRIHRIRIEFCLDPAPRWSGRQQLKLHIWDSLGKRHRVRAVFQPVPTRRAAPSAGGSASQ